MFVININLCDYLGLSSWETKVQSPITEEHMGAVGGSWGKDSEERKEENLSQDIK